MKQKPGGLRQGERRCLLRWRHRIGRDPGQDLIIPHRSVSLDHAIIVWTTRGWEIRDLGSRNGTFVAGRELGVGERSLLHAQEAVRFGYDGPIWVVEEVGPPVAYATCLEDDQQLLLSRFGMLVLASEQGDVTVYRDGQGQWIWEERERTHFVEDRLVVRVGDQRWRLHLPDRIVNTVERLAPQFESLTFCFRQEEQVRLLVKTREEVFDLGKRVHHQVLLYLARERLNDRELKTEHQGWTAQCRVVEELGVDCSGLHRMVFRARQQFGQVGIEGAASIVERQGDSVRFGGMPERIVIE